MQRVVPADSPTRSLADLAGQRVALSANGSGAALFGDRLPAASGVRAAVDHQSFAEAVRRVTYAVARVLVRSAPQLVPSQALGTQYVEQRSLIPTSPALCTPAPAPAHRDQRG